MRTVNQTEFRDHMGKYLAMVQEGEEIEIRRRGEPVAIVKPVSRKGDPYWKLPHEPLKLPGVSLSKIIIEDRV